MPRTTTKLYSSATPRADLEALCLERNLPIQSGNRKQLPLNDLKKQLDSFQKSQSEFFTATTDSNSSESVEDIVSNSNTMAAAADAEHNSAADNEETETASIASQAFLSTSSAFASGTQVPFLAESSAQAFVQPLPFAFDIDAGKQTPVQSELPTSSSVASIDTAEASLYPSEEATSPQPGLLGIITGESQAPDEPLSSTSKTASATPKIPKGPYFLQLSHSKLGTYLSRAIISPVALDSDAELHRLRPSDLLTEHPHFLPLTLGRLPNFSNQDVLVELTLRPEEVARIVPMGSIYALAEPLPVSRIRRLIFAHADAYTEAQADAKTYKNFFLPQNNVVFLDAEEASVSVVDAPNKTTEDAPIPNYASSWTDKLQQFDQQLGLFGYLKHAPLLQANATLTVQDYSAEMQFAFNLLNAAVVPASGSDVVMRTLLRLNPPQPKTAGQFLLVALVNSIYAGEEASFEWANHLLDGVIKQSQATNESLQGLDYLLATKEQIDLLSRNRTNYQSALATIARGGPQSIPQAPFAAVVLLSKFPNRARSNSDKQAVLDTLGKAADRKALASPLLDWLLAILGLYYSYSRFSREDPNLTIRDPQLAALAQPLHRLRFNTDLFADRAIIETVFRFVAEGKPLNDPLGYLRTDGNGAKVIELPLHAGALPTSRSLFNTPPKAEQPVTSKVTHVTSSQEPNVDSSTSLHADVHLYQSIVHKMVGWIAPNHFQQLMSNFTPEEQELLRQFVAHKE